METGTLARASWCILIFRIYSSFFPLRHASIPSSFSSSSSLILSTMMVMVRTFVCSLLLHLCDLAKNLVLEFHLWMPYRTFVWAKLQPYWTPRYLHFLAHGNRSPVHRACRCRSHHLGCSSMLNSNRRKLLSRSLGCKLYGSDSTTRLIIQSITLPLES